MVDAVNIDDTDPSITYSGSWQILSNSPLEFGGGVHSTTQKGASATITFKGTRLQMFCTVANGTGNETADFIFDGRSGPSLTRNSHPDMSYYKDGWFDSGPVPDDVHVLTVSNGGGPSDTPFQIDYFSVNGSVVQPSGTQTPSAAASSTSASNTPTSGFANTSPESRSKSSSTAAIVGGVIGGLIFLVFLLVLAFLYRRRRAQHIVFSSDHQETVETTRPRTLTSVTPFQLDSNPTTTSPSGESRTNIASDNFTTLTEKAPLSDASLHPSSTPTASPDSSEAEPHPLTSRQRPQSDAPPSYEA